VGVVCCGTKVVMPARRTSGGGAKPREWTTAAQGTQGPCLESISLRIICDLYQHSESIVLFLSLSDREGV
jgi:hypothetical protein